MNTIHNIADILSVVENFYKILDGKIEIDSEGWPIFRKCHFITDWPEDMVSYDNRNSSLIKNKEKTLLCHFAGDRQNYRRFQMPMDDIPVYREFYGVVTPDITITKDMDQELQALLMQANQLYGAIFAVNGIKIALNTRNGSMPPEKSFQHIPRNVICVSGFLGCDRVKNHFEASEYINKILSLMPQKLIIYGKQDPIVNDELDLLGIDYRYYDDFHRRCSKRKSA